jgi:hypothetical protein
MIKQAYFLLAEHGEQSPEKVKELFEVIADSAHSDSEAVVFKSKYLDGGTQIYYGLFFDIEVDEESIMPLLISDIIMDEEDNSFVSEALNMECSPESSIDPFVFYGTIGEEVDEGYLMLSYPDEDNDDEATKYVTMPYVRGFYGPEGSGPSDLAAKYTPMFASSMAFIHSSTRLLSTLGKIIDNG